MRCTANSVLRIITAPSSPVRNAPQEPPTYTLKAPMIILLEGISVMNTGRNSHGTSSSVYSVANDPRTRMETMDTVKSTSTYRVGDTHARHVLCMLYL